MSKVGTFLKKDGGTLLWVGGIAVTLYIAYPVLKGVLSLLSSTSNLLGTIAGTGTHIVDGVDYTVQNPSLALLPFPYNFNYWSKTYQP